MATTTNYGWDTPDDTDLVKDGASAIRTLGSSIDTTTKNLNPQTTTGAIAYRSSTANVNTSLPLGTAGQVLKVNAGATAPEWGSAAAGNLIETAFTSSNASWTIPSGVTRIWALLVGSGGGGGASQTATANNSGGAGGAGQVVETVFTISGDTTLNITVPAGGAGGTTTGADGSNGSAATIVGNTSATTYATAAGGGGGAGPASGTGVGLTGASGGGNATTGGSGGGGGGGGFLVAGANADGHPFAALATTIGGGGTATTKFVTGQDGGITSNRRGGVGITIWNRQLGGGGSGAGTGANSATTFGGAISSLNANAGSGTANTGGGGAGASTSTSTKYNGGNGGSGLVVLRYIGQGNYGKEIGFN